MKQFGEHPPLGIIEISFPSRLGRGAHLNKSPILLSLEQFAHAASAQCDNHTSLSRNNMLREQSEKKPHAGEFNLFFPSPSAARIYHKIRRVPVCAPCIGYI